MEVNSQDRSPEDWCAMVVLLRHYLEWFQDKPEYITQIQEMLDQIPEEYKRHYRHKTNRGSHGNKPSKVN